MFAGFWDKIASVVAPVASPERLLHHWIEVHNEVKARALLEGKDVPQDQESTQGMESMSEGKQ